MKQILSWKKLPLLVLAFGIVITVSVAQSNSATQANVINDTIPSKQKKVHDLDDALAEIDRGEAEMQRALKEIDQEKLEREIRQAMKSMEIDMARAKEELEKAMKDFDAQKINAEVQKALKEVDAKKIEADVQKALQEVDAAKISEEIKKALKEVDAEKIRGEVEAALAQVDMEKVKAEMEKVKAIDLSKMKEELANIQPQVEKAMKEAKVSLEKARKEITAYKNLVEALERDGHLKKGGQYKISYKNDVLTVNGKTLSAEETKKYSALLAELKEFTLEKNEDGLEIDK